MLRLGGAFPATADPTVLEKGQTVYGACLLHLPWRSPWSLLTHYSIFADLGARFPWNGGWGGRRLFPPLLMGVLQAFPSGSAEGLTVPNGRPCSVPHPPPSQTKKAKRGAFQPSSTRRATAPYTLAEQ